MSNKYAEVIDVISDQSNDWRAIVIEAAKIAPSVISRAASNAKHGPWQKQAKALLAAGEKLEAIKLCRNMTGMTLKDAKEACEAL